MRGVVLVCIAAPVELLRLSPLCWTAGWPVGAAQPPFLLGADRSPAAPCSAIVVRSSARQNREILKMCIWNPCKPGFKLTQAEYQLRDNCRKHLIEAQALKSQREFLWCSKKLDGVCVLEDQPSALLWTLLVPSQSLPQWGSSPSLPAWASSPECSCHCETPVTAGQTRSVKTIITI